jgi:hypothetical protein
VILLDRILFGGVRFVLDQITTAVDREMNDEGSLREELLAAQMRFELGEIDEADFVALERELLDRLREVRRQREEGSDSAADGRIGLSPGTRVVGAEVSFVGDDDRGESDS